jgi:hypothetical protein
MASDSVREFLINEDYMYNISTEEFLSMIKDPRQYEAAKKLNRLYKLKIIGDIDIKKGYIIKLRLNFDKSSIFPKEILVLKDNLETLFIYGKSKETTELKDINSLVECKYLKTLYIGNIILDELPKHFGKLKSLEELKLSRLSIRKKNCLTQLEISEI